MGGNDRNSSLISIRLQPGERTFPRLSRFNGFYCVEKRLKPPAIARARYTRLKPGLEMPGGILVKQAHADLRVSLREVRSGFGSAGAFQRVGGDEMPPVRLVETGEEALGLRVLGRRTGCAGKLRRTAQVLRDVRDGQAPFALGADFAGGNFDERFHRPSRLLTQKFFARELAGGDRQRTCADGVGAFDIPRRVTDD